MDDQNPQDPQTAAQPTATNDTDFATLQAELESSKAKLAELTQISQHALADLQNYKKRTEDEKLKFVSFANSALITDLLPTLDNIERSLAHIPEDPAAKEWANGIIATAKQMEEILKIRGLEKIETAGLTFDPSLHEAVLTEAGPQDQIIRELEKGYKLSDRILRRAKVTVGNTSPENAAATPETPAPSAPTDEDIYS